MSANGCSSGGRLPRNCCINWGGFKLKFLDSLEGQRRIDVLELLRIFDALKDNRDGYLRIF
jgi:hypothetical protein